MPGARAIAVTSLARSILADPAIFSRGASLEEAIAKLRALPGIGEWTAQYIAMRELREPDAFPAADIGLMRAMATADGQRPSPAELLSRAERWRPWRAYAALHLWAAGSAHPAAAAARKIQARAAGKTRAREAGKPNAREAA
jgi:AraC family transcriptional regulator of adaptative response / DNA-3-methyladenine glycosylase II